MLDPKKRLLWKRPTLIVFFFSGSIPPPSPVSLHRQANWLKRIETWRKYARVIRCKKSGSLLIEMPFRKSSNVIGLHEDTVAGHSYNMSTKGGRCAFCKICGFVICGPNLFLWFVDFRKSANTYFFFLQILYICYF